jgi:hypothetical protein
MRIPNKKTAPCGASVSAHRLFVQVLPHKPAGFRRFLARQDHAANVLLDLLPAICISTLKTHVESRRQGFV